MFEVVLVNMIGFECIIDFLGDLGEVDICVVEVLFCEMLGCDELMLEMFIVFEVELVNYFLCCESKVGG